jgi:hypothetical protein
MSLVVVDVRVTLLTDSFFLPYLTPTGFRLAISRAHVAPSSWTLTGPRPLSVRDAQALLPLIFCMVSLYQPFSYYQLLIWHLL